MKGASVRLLATLARAVHHAHQRGVLHRDLKPANILLEWRMNSPETFFPMIADFGLARQLALNSATTTTGDVVGTPSYMSPEQALSRKDLSTAVDVYGLGAIFYELLTGEPPFRSGSALETIQRVIAEEVRRPSTITPDVDLDLETLCLRGLQKEPNERYPSALALAEDLERWLAGEPITARRVSRWERTWRWCWRNPGWAAMTTLVAILLLTISVGGLVLNFELRNTVEQSEKRRKELEVADRCAENSFWNRTSRKHKPNGSASAPAKASALWKPSLGLRNWHKNWTSRPIDSTNSEIWRSRPWLYPIFGRSGLCRSRSRM